MTEKEKREGLLENVAAISGEIWSNKSRFYQRFGEDLSGFPGVWKYTITAAEAFSKAEERFEKEIGTKPEYSYEYIAAILSFAEWLSIVGELPTISELEKEAWACILLASG